MKINSKIICGILNVTPDSFSDGGLYLDKEASFKRASQMILEGAKWIDAGGQSSRPFSKPVSWQEEADRVIPVIHKIRKEFSDIIISVDTYYPEVAIEAIKTGVDVINDITGLRNEKMMEVILKYKKAVVIMHMKGTPSDMQKNPYYNDVISEIKSFFEDRIKMLKSNNFDDIIIDPGIGFGKTLEHNITIIKNMKVFKSIGYPVMFGPSRKSFIGMISGEKDPKKRVSGSVASCLYCYDWVDIFRVHDVYELNQAFSLYASFLK
jgi:dihydropteroate synthase